MTNQTLPQIDIYTDGGADPNPGPGGWGVVMIHPERTRELSGGEAHTTNNRMELTAALEALKALTRPCAVGLYTDSQYLKNGIQKWMAGWERNGWRDSKGEPVTNADLWQQLALVVPQHEITWHWVRGHTGDKHNERADQLASAAIPRTNTELASDAVKAYLRIAGPAKGGGKASGWAAALVQNGEMQKFTGCHPNASINHFHILAALGLLRQLPEIENLHLFTNNSYLYDGITTWVPGWNKKGWKPDTQFKDDWQALDRESRARKITWHRLREDIPVEFAVLEDTARRAREKC